ncbi:helix-turn-helix transcriptional regulator [Candidatus Woesearchaeota archaeon]|nr:helix-turn-helix transcriptional regulator [Candidatus Woesearchaeota archaeon]
MRFTRITIIKTRQRPARHDINELLQWLGGSLGLFNPRDKDKSCYRVFLALIKDLKASKQGLTSDEVAAATKLSRGTAIHHLNRLMEAGIVLNERGRYALRVDTLEGLVAEIRTGVDQAFDGMQDVAKYLDDRLEL